MFYNLRLRANKCEFIIRTFFSLAFPEPKNDRAEIGWWHFRIHWTLFIRLLVLVARKQMTSSIHYFIYNSTTCWQSLCTKTTEAHALFQVSHGKMNEKNTWHENNIYSVLSGVIVTGCRWKNASKCHNIYTHNQMKYEICAKMPLSVELLRDDTGAVDDLKFIAI